MDEEAKGYYYLFSSATYVQSLGGEGTRAERQKGQRIDRNLLVWLLLCSSHLGTERARGELCK